MKRSLPSLLLCVLFFFQLNTSFGQKNSESVLLSEDFDGLSVLPTGWAAYTVGWDIRANASNFLGFSGDSHYPSHKSCVYFLFQPLIHSF